MSLLWRAVLLPAVLLVAPGLSVPVLWAQEATPYGEKFARLGAHWSDAGQAVERAATPAAPGPASEALGQRLEALEMAGGPYAPGLSEALSELARQYRDNGELAQAIDYYGRALHNLRVNDGLYSERQIPLVRELLSLYRATGDLEALDGRYDYFFRLYGSGQPPYDEVRLRATLEYLRWQREAYRRGLREGDRALLRLYEQTAELTDTVLADPAVGQAWRRELAFNQLRNLYLISDRVEPLVELFGAAGSRPFMGPDAQGTDLTRERLESIERTVLARGRDLLEDLLAREPLADPVARAAVYRELGDWYQWHHSSPRARDAYAQAISLLQAAGEQDLIAAWWHEPVELPDNGAFWQPADQDADTSSEVLASFSVSSRGRASAIDVGANDDSVAGAASRLRRELAATRFRPAFSDGQPIAVENLQRRYTIFP